MLKCFVLVGFFYSYYLLCDRLISLFACDQYSHLARSVKYIKANRFFFKLILFRSAIYRHIEMFCVFVYIRSFFLMIEMYWCDLWYIWSDGGKFEMYWKIDFFLKVNVISISQIWTYWNVFLFILAIFFLTVEIQYWSDLLICGAEILIVQSNFSTWCEV